MSVSRVYPCYVYLKSNITKNLNQKIHTKELRKDLLNAVNSRFESLVDSDLFKIATFLDCNFGLSAFEKDQQLEIRRLIKSTLL